MATSLSWLTGAHELECDIASRFLSSSQASSCSAEDGLKATAFLTDALFDEETAHSYKPEHAPVSHAYDRPIFDFFAAPGNEAYLKRFGMAMYAINSIMQGEATLATGAFFFRARVFRSLPHF